jgi:NMD protein affecting ribosome stability and mRNA decay
MSAELRSLTCINCGASDFESKSETEWECRYCGTGYTLAEGLCPFCGFVNSPQAGFCGQCGKDLAWVCPVCGVENRVTATHCPSCGWGRIAAERMVYSRTVQRQETREVQLAADLEAAEADQRASEARLQRMWAQEEVRQAAIREAQARQREKELRVLYIIAAVFIFLCLLIVVAVIVQSLR